MKKIVLGLVMLLVAGLICSCEQPHNTPDTSHVSDEANEDYPTLQPNNYNNLFRVRGYYIRYDGIHYKYMLGTVEQVKEIIKYYYPDCFDIKVFLPGSPETGYLNIYFYATWKSYMNYVEIK